MKTLIAIAASWLITVSTLTQEMKFAIPRDQKPILRVLPPKPSEQSPSGTGKFVLFTREQIGTNWDFIAGAWECIPSHPETPITKRVECCHSSWNGAPLLDTLVIDDSAGKYPRFLRLWIDQDERQRGSNLYDINYRTWDVRCLWQGGDLNAFGVLGTSIFCKTPEGWFLLDGPTGQISKGTPFIPVETDGRFWLVKRFEEADTVWSYDRVEGRYVGHFGVVPEPDLGRQESLLSPDGKTRAWVLAPMPDGWRGGKLPGKLLLQRSGLENLSTDIVLYAKLGRGIPMIPVGLDLRFTAEGAFQVRTWNGDLAKEELVWNVEVATGQITSTVAPHRKVADPDPAFFGGVPVPDYLRKQVRGFPHFGRAGLAPAFLLHMGILSTAPEYPDCTAGVSPDGEHILYLAKKGKLAGIYIYGNLVTKKTVRWRSPPGLDYRDSQTFVWVQTP